MSEILDTVLLLALPGSGKSELRRYLGSLSPEVCRRDFHMGQTVGVDDFPYVQFLRDTDEALAKRLGGQPLFFPDPSRPFRDLHEWVTLIELLNDDVSMLGQRPPAPASAAMHLFERIDRAELRAGARLKLGRLLPDVREALAKQMEPKAAAILQRMARERPQTMKEMEGKTTVIEFARGGPHGAAMPLDPPRGYLYSLSRLAPTILEQAVILYAWVTPEESRRKNLERVPPPGVDDTGVFHVVPLTVMEEEYGTDDIVESAAGSTGKGRVRVEAHGKVYSLPIACFDNRGDKTTFLREPQASWPLDKVAAVHRELKDTMDALWEARATRATV